MNLARLKETSWVAFGQTLAFLGSLAGIKLLTNLMSPENYGDLALGLALAGIINLFLFGPLGQVVLRFYSPCYDKKNIGGYASVLISLYKQAILLLAIISVPIGFIINYALGSNWINLFILAVIFGVFSGIQGSFSLLLNALRDRKSAAFTQGLDTWLRLSFAVVIIIFGGHQGYWIIIGYILGSLVIISIQTKTARRHGVFISPQIINTPQNTVLRTEFMAYGLPFMAFAGLASISLYADRWLLQGLWSTEVVGIYTAMFQIASAPIIFLMAVANQLIIPIVFSRSGNLENKKHTVSSQALLRQSVIIIAILYAVATLLAYKWGEALIILLTNSKYAQYAPALWILVLSQALFNLAQFMVATGLNLNRPRAYFAPKLGQAISLLLASILLVRHGGIEGMSRALLISSVVYIIWVKTVNIKLWREHVETNT